MSEVSNAAPAVEPLAWQVNLGSDRPEKRWIVLAIACVVGLFALLVLRSAALAAFGFLATLASTAELFLPLKYKLDVQGASMQCGLSASTIEWKAVKRIAADESGVKVTPFEKPHRLDPFRGVYLRFAGNREEVLAKIAALQSNGERILDSRDHARAIGGDA